MACIVWCLLWDSSCIFCKRNKEGPVPDIYFNQKMWKHVDSKHDHWSNHSTQYALCSSIPYTQETEPKSSEPHGSCKLFNFLKWTLLQFFKKCPEKLWYLHPWLHRKLNWTRFWTMGHNFKVGPSLTKKLEHMILRSPFQSEIFYYSVKILSILCIIFFFFSSWLKCCWICQMLIIMHGKVT